MGPLWTEPSRPALGLSGRLAACDICHQPACLAPDSAQPVQSMDCLCLLVLGGARWDK